MDWQIGFTLLVMASVLGILVLTTLAVDVVLLAALALLLITGVLEPAEALIGFSNPGVMTIAVLYVVAGGLQDTGAVQWLVRIFLGYPRSVTKAQIRILLPTSVISAFMNNTAVVAMFIPAVQEWAERLNLSPSKFLLPLSYAAILGGTCTLIGTSTNLVIDGLLQSQMGISLGLFDLAWVGVPLLFTGGAFLVFFGHRLLPSYGGLTEELNEIREYSVQMKIPPDSPLVGKTISEAGLRSLRHGYLAEIERGNDLITLVAPDRILQAADYLRFIGAPECASELRRIQGLKVASGNVEKLDMKNHQRCLVEVVLGPDFTALNQSVRESCFRTRFNAVVLSISRSGKRVEGKLGDIVFQPGDTLLLETSEQFVEHYRYRRDFLLVSALNDSTPPNFHKAPYALVILIGMVVISATNILSILEAAFLAAGAMLVSGCLTATRARRSVDYSVLVIIGASYALGNAIVLTGAAKWLSSLLVSLGPLSPWLALGVVYFMTAALTELLTNNAAAVLMFPISVAIAEQLGLSVMPFAISVMFAASASFITPLGYQTNLMVYGPGRYQFRDYVIVGVPMAMIAAIICIVLIPLVWKF